jgi:hypothetical protein
MNDPENSGEEKTAEASGVFDSPPPAEFVSEALTPEAGAGATGEPSSSSEEGEVRPTARITEFFNDTATTEVHRVS